MYIVNDIKFVTYLKSKAADLLKKIPAAFCRGGVL